MLEQSELVYLHDVLSTVTQNWVARTGPNA
ncbi:hypothetical protein RSAG8_09751, partial [Rhizoctonia solani AG-8 WAC10335]